MAATVEIHRLTGSGPTETNIAAASTNRMSQLDNAAPGTSGPIPAVSTSLSAWIATRLNCTVAPSNLINNLQWFTDGVAMATGLTLKGEKATGYTQAVTSGLTVGGAGELTVAHYTTGTLSSPVNLISTYTSGSTKTLSGSTSTTGLFGDHMVYQLNVTSSASPGTIATSQLTWQYDET
jgi:hypothetical protein